MKPDAMKPEAISPEAAEAGDAFTAALTLCIAEGKDYSEAARFAAAAGALAVTRFGTLPAMPSRSEIEAFLADRTQDLLR